MTVPSFISSSSDRVPPGPPLRQWVAALGVTLLACLGWSSFWSARGFSAGVDDSPHLWAVTRARVEPRTTVILGTSRAQAEIDPRVWERVWPGVPVVNLAIEGRSPVAPLASLAADRRVAGLVVVDFPPRFVFDATQWQDDVRQALAAYGRQQSSPALQWEAALRRRVPFGFPLTHPSLALRPITEQLLQGRLPMPPAFTTRPDRFRPLVHPDADTVYRTGRPGTAAERDSIIAIVAAAVQAITRRGGTVVFVRLPTCGAVREIEETLYPTRDYWDAVRARVPGVFVAEDITALDGAAWRCADGSHLFSEETEPFTRAVVGAVRGAVGGTRRD